MANMKAGLITRFKDASSDGAIIEWVVWRLPKPVPPSKQNNKYCVVFIVDGVRVVGFDNERGKGDHLHLIGVERAYDFRGVQQLVEDFIAA
jgi:hypothetical protein